jgi:hypothetical protein
MITQELLQKMWQQGWFWETKTKTTFDQPTRATQPVIRLNSQTYKGARHLEKYGSITCRDAIMWANSPTDVIHHLREAGFIKAKAYDTWETGQSGKRYKRYWWTGKTLEGKK